MPLLVFPHRVTVKHEASSELSLTHPLICRLSFLSLITLLLSVESAHAEWASVVTKVEEGRTAYTVYVDPDSIHYNGDLVTFWALMDFTTRQTVPSPPYMSVRSRREIDCTEEQIRLLAVTAYSGNMGSGEVVYTYSDSVKDRGITIEPGSVAQSLWKFVCANIK